MPDTHQRRDWDERRVSPFPCFESSRQGCRHGTVQPLLCWQLILLYLSPYLSRRSEA